MIHRHDFQQAARHFRSGRISLNEFTDKVFGPAAGRSVEQREYVFPRRAVDAHKGEFGRVLMVGGSVGMSGAIALAGQAALRTGSGLVRVVTPLDVQSVVASFYPCLMVVPASSSDGALSEQALDEILQHAAWADVIAMGPGMGCTPAGQQLASKLYQQLSQPLLVDADGLNNLAWLCCDLSDHAGPRILTPHAGEFQRLSGESVAERKQLEKSAVEFAGSHGVTVVLKGHRTLITDGTSQFYNPSGNDGLATAGTGDVLTGVVISLLGQGLTPNDAARTGCYLHGLAGDLAAKRRGKSSLVATDLFDFLPQAIEQLQKESDV